MLRRFSLISYFFPASLNAMTHYPVGTKSSSQMTPVGGERDGWLLNSSFSPVCWSGACWPTGTGVMQALLLKL